MNPWTRLGLAAAAVVAVALLLKVLPPFVVLAMLLAGLAAVSQTLRKRSRADAARGREALLGLRRSPADPFGLRALPLSLFGRAPEGSIEDLMHGSWRGVEVQAFDYVFPSSLPGGPEVRRAFSCALSSIASPVPAVVMEPQAFVTMLPRPPELDRVDVGSGRFGALFEVRSADADAARSLLSDRMIDLLLELDETWGFEVTERAALAYGPRRDRDEPTGALDALVGFLDRLPGTMWRSAMGGQPPARDDPVDG